LHYELACPKADAILIERDRDVLRRSQSAAPPCARKEGAAQVRIDSLEVIASSGRIDLAEALAWAAKNRTFLAAKWAEYSGDGQ
jgi:hypothetical protein